ncbi:hypothetical protein [Limnofasciculus baicalensis]|uniref:Uncharacterized protein n=1 Tax=Limnofasciculus baicalensis BBK-W-15 TaxID=2699891 RepID=A0AAE3GTD7_9CYAN|nr:hypothetical protein [Limnofasciculus baicalensis]MCP2729533.1 hypothetical protein [Limnofasciculus baicalensis BBK-W-15]
MSRFLLPVLSLILYISCLASPAILFEKICGGSNSKDFVAGLWNVPNGATESSWGIALLLLGAIGVIFIQYGAMGWLANPFYFLALITSITSFRNNLIFARIFIVGAIGFALSSLHLTNWFPLLADEGGVCYLSAIQPLLGYWLWLSAMGLLAIHIGFRKRTFPTQMEGVE